MTPALKGNFMNGKTVPLLVAVCAAIVGALAMRAFSATVTPTELRRVENHIGAHEKNRGTHEDERIKSDRIFRIATEEIEKAIAKLETRIVPVIETTVRRVLDDHEARKSGG